MKIAIRTDASLLIGSGHVMRCKTLADELRSRGAEVVFICRAHQGNLIPLLREDGYYVMVLPAPNSMNLAQPDKSEDYSAWLGVEQSGDAQQTIEALGDFKPNWIVVDHYGLDESWEQMLREHVGKVFVIDDLVNRPHDCDVLLNQNLLDDLDNDYRGLVPYHCRKLLGPRFALLRPEFRKARETLRERDGTIRRILVFFGGVDPTGETEKALDAIEQLDTPEIAVDVVVGSNNPRGDAIEARCRSLNNVAFHCQVSNMAALMASADLALGAGGTAVWERCCLGLPTLVTIIADNQSESTLNLANRGALIIVGIAGEVETLNYKENIRVLTPDRIKAIQAHGFDIVDGRGIDRVILSMSDKPIQLRRATFDDAEKLWQWRNHPDTRRYSSNSSPISLETHLSWWKQSFCVPSRVILMGCCAESEIGILRYDLIDEYKAEVSIYLDPELHGLGLGTSLLRAGQKWILRNLPNVIEIKATIIDKNVVSKRAFASAGFHQNSVSMIWVKDAGPSHNNESIVLMKT